MEIRLLSSSDDRLAVSRVYEESWRYAYAGIVPQDYLDSIPAGRWAGFVDREGIHSLVMLDGDRIAGTLSVCRSRFPEMPEHGEIVSIYLLPQYMGRGLGAPLLNAAVAELHRMGFNDIFLWVLEENLRARRFYEKNGFCFCGRYLDDNIGGKPLREMMYVHGGTTPPKTE